MSDDDDTVSETTIKNVGGRPPHEPNETSRNKVKTCAAVGIAQQDIARLLNVSINTLRKHYLDELETGSIEANASIGGTIFQKAKAGDTACLIWWTKSRMRWSEKTEIEHSGQIDGEHNSRVVFEFSDVVEEDPQSEA